MARVPPISATFTSTPQTVLGSYRACHPVSLWIRWGSAALVVLLGLLLGNIILIVLGVGFPFFSEWSVRRRLRPYLGQDREVTVTVTEQEYRVDGGEESRAWPWTSVRAVVRRRGFWVLKVSRIAALAFPDDALDAAQTEAFVALVEGKGLLRS